MRSEQMRKVIKNNFPTFIRLLTPVKMLLFKMKPMKSKFSQKYFTRGFGGTVSVSGPGSDLVQTKEIIRELPILVRELNVRVLVDVPCGDFFWMKTLKLEIEKYIGVDIVSELIRNNSKIYGNKNREFISMDITKNILPRADLILCRDCFVHLSFKDTLRSIKNFKKSLSGYLLTTTFTELSSNKDVITGGWRPLNLQLPPFSFPEPIRIINEKCTEEDGRLSDKCLGLWRLDDILK